MTNDPGKHYRGRRLGHYVIDPYRILELYPNITREPARHMVKKLLRFVDKGHSEEELIAELQDCLRRWSQMLTEDMLREIDDEEVQRMEEAAKVIGPIFKGSAAEPAPITFHEGEVDCQVGGKNVEIELPTG